MGDGGEHSAANPKPITHDMFKFSPGKSLAKTVGRRKNHKKKANAGSPQETQIGNLAQDESNGIFKQRHRCSGMDLRR
jgi:hypothetical protein